MNVDWTVEKISPTVSTIKIPYIRNKDWEQWVFVSADRHLDTP